MGFCVALAVKPDLSDEDKPFQCSECLKRFTREDNGKVHIKRAHGGIGTIHFYQGQEEDENTPMIPVTMSIRSTRSTHTVDSESVETEQESKRKRPKRASSQQLPSVELNPILPKPMQITFESPTKVRVIEWISPMEFYVQLESMEADFHKMMSDIQKNQNENKTIREKVPINSLVLVYEHKDKNLIKRAKVIGYSEKCDSYRVQFIDFGTKYVCKLLNMYELNKQFTVLPPLAICCTFDKVILNKSIPEIREKVRLLINSTPCICTFLASEDDLFIVDIDIDRDDFIINVKNLLICDEFITNESNNSSNEKAVNR